MSQADEQTNRSPGKYVGTIGLLFLGAYLFASIFVEFILIIEFWPIPLEEQVQEQIDGQAATGTPSPSQVDRHWKPDYCLFFRSGECQLTFGDGKVTDDQRLIILVLLAGGIGGMVHTLRSYVKFTGSRQLTRSWIWWYVFRPVEGSIVALVFYLVVRAGLTPDISSDSSAFGVVGLSTLVGMFSQQVVTKLKEIAETIFAKPKTKELPDKLPELVTQPAKIEPKIESLSPAAITRGSESLTVKITGTGFTRDSIARVDGKERSTEYISETELTITLDPSDVANAGERKIDVWDRDTDLAAAALELKVI